MKHSDYNKLLSLRVKLTKCFLISLIFNCFIQLEAVENYFNSTLMDSQQIVSSVDFCGSNALLISKTDHNLSFLGLFTLGAPAPSDLKISGLKLATFLIPKSAKTLLNRKYLRFHSSKDDSNVSGLSPPTSNTVC